MYLKEIKDTKKCKSEDTRKNYTSLFYLFFKEHGHDLSLKKIVLMFRMLCFIFYGQLKFCFRHKIVSSSVFFFF